MKSIVLLFVSVFLMLVGCTRPPPDRPPENGGLAADLQALRAEVAVLRAANATRPAPVDTAAPENPEEEDVDEETVVEADANAGPQCGQVGPSVGYVDANPLPNSMCEGRCAIVRNTTNMWMTVRTAGGMQMLICGGYQPLRGVPPRTEVTWINHVGTGNFVLEFWSQELDGSFTLVEERRFSTTFPFRAFGRDDEVGMACSDRNC